jgi:energy-coupling factor transporter transmembrane protein EcfT
LALRVLFNLPRVWFSRVILRAQRIADAMELRGLCQVDLKAIGTVRPGGIDRLAMLMGLFLLAISILVRWGLGR